MELTDHASRIIKTDKSYRHLSPETPSQGIIAQTPQFVSNMHFSTRTLKTLTNSENNNWGPGCSKLYVYHTSIIILRAIALKINSEGEQLSKLRTLILGQNQLSCSSLAPKWQDLWAITALLNIGDGEHSRERCGANKTKGQVTGNIYNVRYNEVLLYRGSFSYTSLLFLERRISFVTFTLGTSSHRGSAQCSQAEN